MIDIMERMRPALYLVAALFVLTPSVEIFVNLVPAYATSPHGVAEVAANHLLWIVFGAALAAGVAALSGARSTVRLLWILSALTGLGLLVLGFSFSLEMQQLLSEVPSGSVDALEIGAWKTGFKLFSTALVLGAIAAALFRLDGSLGRAQDDGAAFLVQRRAA